MYVGVEERGIGIGGCGRWMGWQSLGRCVNSDVVERTSHWGISL